MGKDLRPVVRIVDKAGQGPEHPGHRPAGPVPVAATLHRQPAGRLRRRRRRRGHQGAAGSVQDPRHHRWSAARGRPVRGAQAQGSRDPGRAFGHHQLRQGHQGQAAPDHQGHRWQRTRGADSQVPPDHRVRRRARGQGRNRGGRRADRRRTSCACWASSRWPLTWSRKSRTSTACRA